MDRKIAFVTGAGRGIGQGIAIELAKAGYDLFVTYSTSKDGVLNTVKQVEELGARIEVAHCDIRNYDEIQATFLEFETKYDHLDLMVNNSGITRFQPFLEATPEMFDTVISTDLRGTYFCAQAAARIMVKHETKGVIINISSNHAFGCWPIATFYAAAKAGVNKMGENMALELAQYGIRVVTVCPGYTEPPTKWFQDTPEGNAARRELTRKIPMNRVANVYEIGKAVVFLASENAGYITGTSLSIDGGSLLPVLAENKLL